MTPNIKSLCIVFFSGVVSIAPSQAQEWPTAPVPTFSYSGDDGPGFWIEKSPKCGAYPYARQSPVNIVGSVVDPTLKPLMLFLDETSFTLRNNDHTIKATPEVGGLLVLNGVSFVLAQFHFHTLSEHTIAGKYARMELHAVFKDSASNLAVIGVLYEVGKKNSFLGKLLTAGLPLKSTSPPVTIDSLNLAEGLTDTAAYYTYPGSLTTPPCDESVTWLVLKQRAQMSEAQFAALQGVLGDDFRPIQKLNGRIISETP